MQTVNVQVIRTPTFSVSVFGGGGSGTPGLGTVTSVGLALPTDVFNVSGSPVTSAGIITATFDTQTANTAFAGPTTGAAAAPTFRALVSDDIPTLAQSKITSLVTDLAGKQPLDSDLTAIAAISPANDDFIQRKAGAWTNRTVAQVKTDLGLTGTNSGDQTITLTGDVTGSGTGSFAATIAANAVTFAKMQAVSANILLGNDATGTAVEEITCTAAGRALLDDADASAQRTTLGLGTLATQNGTFSGTSSGTNTGDQTITNSSDATSHTVTLSASGGSVQLVEGSGITLTTTGTSGAGVVTIAATAGGGGTVTSVALDLPAAIFDVSGSPVTTSGTLTATLDTQTANTVFSGPTTGAAATPTFRALVSDDIPTLAQSKITSLVTDLAGKQPLDSDLTAIAALTPSNDDFIQRKAGAWTNRTVAQVKTDLGLTGTNSGDQTITLTGDVTGSGTGSFAATIAAGAVTFAKMQAVSANILLGNDATGTAVEEITCTAAGRAILDDADASAQRTTLGLGTLATQNGTFSATTAGVLVTDPNGDAITTGDGKAYIRIHPAINGLNLTAVGASVSTVSSSGAVTVQVRRVRSGSPVDMLSTAITIDASENDSATAATAAVINTSNDDIATADYIHIDIDGAGTGAKGLFVSLTFS